MDGILRELCKPGRINSKACFTDLTNSFLPPIVSPNLQVFPAIIRRFRNSPPNQPTHTRRSEGTMQAVLAVGVGGCRGITGQILPKKNTTSIASGVLLTIYDLYPHSPNFSSISCLTRLLAISLASSSGPNLRIAS